MAIDTKNIGAINAYQKLNQVEDQKLHKDKPNQSSSISNALERVETNVTKQELRQQQQASLIAHLFSDGKTKDESAMRITYQSAIEKINQILLEQIPQKPFSTDETLNQETPKPISEEALQAQGGMEYWTPENTAKRIVQGATNLFDAYKNANPDLQGEALINRFMEVIGGGLEEGFGEARNILDDLDVLEGSIAENIDKTVQLVTEGMQNFEKAFLDNLIETSPTDTKTE